MKRISLRGYKDRKSWLELRRTGIGGSDAGIILELNKYKTVMELWLDKSGLVELDDTESEAAYFGHLMEPVIREEFTKRSGISVMTTTEMYQSEDYPFMNASLDGEVYDAFYGMCVFEAKTVSAYKAGEWEDDIPASYYAQLQHYMAVTEYKGAYIAALINGNRFVYRFVERDDVFIEKLIKAESAFWDMVQKGIMPEVDGSDATKKYLGECYPVSKNGEAVDLGKIGMDLVEQYDMAVEVEAQAKEAKQYIENQLKDLMKEREIGLAGERKVTWKTVVSNRLDSKLLKANEPEMFEKYAKESKCRRFSVS